MTAQILAIDDDEVNLEIISELLHDSGASVTLAGDGLAGWELLDGAPDRFDVLLLDRIMPRLDGIELARRLCADPRFYDLPIIMQTAAASTREVAEGLAAGAWYYLAKPCSPDLLRRVVRAALTDRSSRLERKRLGTHFVDTVVYLREGQYRFRTLPQVALLAARLGSLCPGSARVSLGLSELMTNAIEHGNLGIGYADKGRLLAQNAWEQEIGRRLAEPAQAERWAEVTLTREPGRLTFTIRDQGPGFDWAPYLDVDPRRVFDAHGRGILMARQLAFETLEYHGCGNLVVATIRL